MISLQLEEITTQECEADKTLCFMSMPIWKFVLLNVLTFGMYFIVWYYKYWRTVRDNYKIKINVIARTIFIIFTCHRLFRIINKHLQQFSMKISPFWLTMTLIIGNFLSRLDDGVFGWCIYLLIFVPSLMIQTKINKINKDHFPQAEKNTWTWKTTGFVALFWLAFLVICIIYAIFVPAN